MTGREQHHALAGALAFNIFTHDSRQLQVTAVPRAQVDTQAAAERLAEAIRFPRI
jgi:carboxypeptidase PM20D1